MKFIELLYMREGYVGIGTPLLSRVRSDIFQYQGFYIRVRVRDCCYSHHYSHFVSSVLCCGWITA